MEGMAGTKKRRQKDLKSARLLPGQIDQVKAGDFGQAPSLHWAVSPVDAGSSTSMVGFVSYTYLPT